jgi:hypothetical protein
MTLALPVLVRGIATVHICAPLLAHGQYAPALQVLTLVCFGLFKGTCCQAAGVRKRWHLVLTGADLVGWLIYANNLARHLSSKELSFGPGWPVPGDWIPALALAGALILFGLEELMLSDGRK